MLAKCVTGASVRDLCKAGDTCMEEELAKVYRKDKNMKKGKDLSQSFDDVVHDSFWLFLEM